ncbi:MAG: GNAT family N-acetyltransferase [Armatimonadota bacterium]
MESVLIRRATVEDAVDLSQLLNEDAILRHEMNVGEAAAPPLDYFEQLTEWCCDEHAETCVIVAHDKAIGAIALSHIDLSAATAQIGYWVGSRHRRHGYCTRAFELMVEQARRQGIATIRATVDESNTPARRILEHAGASVHPIGDGKVFCELDLARQPEHASCG